ncbi:MAG: heat-inducible transcription repressor HrcA [Nitrospiraceae bacterium]|nr:MAG: heat-inducible transcription repressor HrcA [Nitrospiraceae bacterium]
MLNERQKKILWAVTQSHIDLNIPIGSLLLIKRYPLNLSSATIRNAMASLEQMGYITQPHTSAGRVPTEKGYRYYVNLLLEDHSLSISDSMSHELSLRLQGEEIDSNGVIKKAAKTLSLLSRNLAIAIPPKIEDMVLKHIKFIKYDSKKALSMLISDDGSVKNTFVELDKPYTQQELDKAAHYINSEFAGRQIKDVKEILSYQLFKDKQAYDRIIMNVLYLFKDSIIMDDDMLSLNSLSGTSYLPDLVDTKQVKDILRAIEDKQFMLKLLNQLSGSKGIKVVVGLESIIPAMSKMSMVAATYNDKKQSGGTIGIIGPTCMNYKKLIPIVEHTAKALTRILSEN